MTGEYYIKGHAIVEEIMEDDKNTLDLYKTLKDASTDVPEKLQRQFYYHINTLFMNVSLNREIEFGPEGVEKAHKACRTIRQIIEEVFGKVVSSNEYQKWEHFKVEKRFTLFPLRIYQWSSQTIWWSWLKTSYIFKEKRHDTSNLFNSLYFYFAGYYWKNCRMSDIDEYNDYLTYIKNNKKQS